MGTQIKELQKLIKDIRKRVDSVCHEKCRECGIDEDKFFTDVKSIDSKNDNVEESLSVSDGAEEKDNYENDDFDGYDSRIYKKRFSAADILGGRNSNAGGTYGGYTSTVPSTIVKADSSINPDIRPQISNIQSGLSDKPGWVANALKKIAKKQLSKLGLKTAATKIGGKAAGREGGKAALKALGKNAGKTVAGKGAATASKTLLKKVPFVGLGVSIPFAVSRAMDGDMAGAGLELASGTSSIVPVAGTAASLGIDAYLADRDIKKETGEGIMTHAKNLISDDGESESDAETTESTSDRFLTLYGRANLVFESIFGLDESNCGYRFDDYVLESKICNNATDATPINESKVFFGYANICESSSEEAELDNLMKKIRADGRVSIADLVEKDSDTIDIINTKRKIKEIMTGENSPLRSGTKSYDLDSKEYKKVTSTSSDPTGKPTNTELWHKGLDEIDSGITRGLANHFVPHSVTNALSIPKNMARMASAGLGAGVGGALLGPVGASVGAMAGNALSNYLANRHEKYKAEQYAKLHGVDPRNIKPDTKKWHYFGPLIGAGLGGLVGGPAGALLGSAVGAAPEAVGRTLSGIKKAFSKK